MCVLGHCPARALGSAHYQPVLRSEADRQITKGMDLLKDTKAILHPGRACVREAMWCMVFRSVTTVPSVPSFACHSRCGSRELAHWTPLVGRFIFISTFMISCDSGRLISEQASERSVPVLWLLQRTTNVTFSVRGSEGPQWRAVPTSAFTISLSQQWYAKLL